MTDDIAHDSGYPERIQIAEYEGDYGSPGDAAEANEDLLRQILHELQRPTVRPRTQIVLGVTAATTTSTVFTSHVRIHVTKLIIPNTPANPFDILIGTSRFLRGWQVNGQFDVDFIVDPGADISLNSTAGNIYNATNTDIILVGDIIN